MNQGHFEEVEDYRLSSINDLAQEQIKLSTTIEEVEEQLKNLKKQYAMVSQQRLPEAMQEVGITDFKTTSGHKITIKKDLYCSVPKARRHEIAQWLIRHGYAHIISEDVTVRYSKGQEDKARQFASELEERGFDNYTVEETFNTATLKSLLKERQEVVDIPDDLDFFGAYEVTQAKIELA